MQPNIHDAIRSLYSNAVTIYGEDVNAIQVLDENGNNIEINISDVNTQLNLLQTNYTTSKTSVITKLTALGLTTDDLKLLGV